MINDLEPKVLICEPDYVLTLEAMRENIDVAYFVSLRGAKIEGAINYDQMETASNSEPERPTLDSESPYCILYTSGTTGYPKGAVIPHRQILYNCINTVVSWGLTEKDISPVYTPLFHAGGLFAFLTPLLYVGGRIILARDFDPEVSMKWILEEECTVILGVPTLFQMWMNSEYFNKADFSKVHFFISTTS